MKRVLALFVASAAAPVMVLAQDKPGRNPSAAEAGMAPQWQAAKTVYDQHCAACHGPNGDGDGPASMWLFPRPRNFSAGLFKIKSTAGVLLPTDEDLLQTVTRGMPGTGMPSFTYLAEEQRWEMVRYVKHLTAYTNGEGKRVNHFEEATARGQSLTPLTVPPEPPITVSSLARGREMYNKMLCFTCHGETGAGDGPNAPNLKDTAGLYLPPRDFNTGAFRGGHTGRDLYLRIATGLPGTPMVPFGDEVLTPLERWHLVHYVQSLRRKEIEISDILQPPDGVIRVPKVKKLPPTPLDAAWESLETSYIPLNPLWPETNDVGFVALHAVHDGRQIAFLLQWRDASANKGPVRIQDFQDAAALQFSLNETPPFLGMGDAKSPVNIWQWRADWQQELDSQRPDVNTVYAAMHTDVYFQTDVLYLTAEAAGNLLARSRHVSSVEDANARGFGTMQSQPPSSQNVHGKGFWRDGSWNVLFRRDLKSRDRDDVQFNRGRPVPVAFAVWDGENRDRNGRKVISNWYQLILE